MRVKLTGIKNMRHYGECEEFNYARRRDGEKGPLVYGSYLPFSTVTKFGIWYYDTHLLSHSGDGDTIIYVGDCVVSTMNTAVVMNHFLPEGYDVRYRFNYAHNPFFGRYKINERLELWSTRNDTKAHCISRDLSGEQYDIVLWSIE